jgi:hypothetical protein
MAISNRLTGPQAYLTSFGTQTTWTPTNATITIDSISELYPDSEYKQIELTLSPGASSCFLDLAVLHLEDSDLNAPLIFLSAIKMPSGGTFISRLRNVEEEQNEVIETSLLVNLSDSVVNAPGVLSPQWSILRSDPITLTVDSGTPALDINLEIIPNEPSESIYFTLPLCYQQFDAVFKNNVLPSVMINIPEVFRAEDIAYSGKPDIPLHRFIDICTLTLDSVYSNAVDYLFQDVSEGFKESDNTTKSTLVNQDVATFETLVWLAKFSGTRPITRFESSLDSLGEPFQLDSSELNSTAALRLTSYLELNPPVLDLTAQENLLRWQLNYGYYGKNAGTLPAVQEAAKLMLTGNKELVTEYDFRSEPWVIHLYSPWDQTFGSIGEEVIGLSSILVLDAVSFAKPLGVLVTHEMTASNG